MSLTIHPEVSDSAGTVGSPPHERPIITTQQADTRVMIADGETVVIGGLIKDKVNKTVRKIPLLGDLPILGYFFRSSTDEKIKTDLIIFITPHIL